MSTPADITATPTANQRILHNDVEYTTIKEGLAHILVPAPAAGKEDGEDKSQLVFYNPIQQFNRDLSVLAIKAFGQSVMEAKQREKQKNRERLAAKKDKKRKRDVGQDSLQEGPKKAGKLDNLNGASSEVEPVPAQVDAPIDEPVNGAEEIPITNLKEKSAAAVTNKVVPAPAKPQFTILDALSATGLRALRYAHEIPFTTSVTANDILATATESIALNAKHNKLDDKIKAITSNAMVHMYSTAGKENSKDETGEFYRKYDVIDLDPYGTAAPFLDAAIQSVRDGGLLCVTCTDAGVWASNSYPEKAYSLYGGTTIKGSHSHEGGLRLILNSIAQVAAKYSIAIEPLLSLSIDFYARVFVKIHKSPADVKFLAGKTMVVYNCDSGCGAWETQMISKNKVAPNKNAKGYYWKHVYEQGPSTGGECKHCGTRTHIAGPMYGGPLHSPEFIKRILDDLPSVSKETYSTTKRIEGVLSVALEESLPALEALPEPISSTGTKISETYAIDTAPFFFIPSALAKTLHCITPHEDAIRGAIRHAGYRVTRSHCKGGSIKTDAPWDFIWQMMREWTRQKFAPKEGKIREGTPGYRIMNLPEEQRPKVEIVFDEILGREVDKKRLVRYQVNPRENWGPMARAKASS